MRSDEHITHLQAHAAALLEAVRADPTAPVPSCPAWNRMQLLGHVGAGHSLARAQLTAGRGEAKSFGDAERPPKGEARFDWFEAGAAALVEALARVDPTETWPTWTGPQLGAWFHRRMAQETAMHRWDVDPTPFDPDLAVDGIDELLGFLEVIIANGRAAQRFADVTGTIHLHAIDEGLAEAGEWLVTFGGGSVTAEKGHARGDAALRGTASDLLLWTMNRVPADGRFEVIGDDGLLHRWTELVVA